MDHLPWHKFNDFVDQYGGNRKVKSFTCGDQYRCMAFAQLLETLITLLIFGPLTPALLVLRLSDANNQSLRRAADS